MGKFFIILLSSVFLLFNSYAAEADIDIPLVLQDLGYSRDDLVDYTTEYNEERFTVANWETEDPADTITFILIDGEIVNWYSR
ncbi:MAG: hypothetical protein PHP17_05065 [Candidatus Omnitrophica bacterium]|nr:hypothetical protein [Candidatus Omnitrophota bacterium]